MVTSLDLYINKINSCFSKVPKKIQHKNIQEICFKSLNADFDISWMILEDAYHLFSQDKMVRIPFIIWLLENPGSPFSLPGSIDLKSHDYVHLLLNRGMSLFDEAFVVGYTMGNCETINNQHIHTYKILSSLLYPKEYKFNSIHIKVFDFGYMYGQKVSSKNIHLVNFDEYIYHSIQEVRLSLGIHFLELCQLWKAEQVLIHSSLRSDGCWN